MSIHEGMWGGRFQKQGFMIDFKTASEENISLWFRHFKPPADVGGNGLLSPGLGPGDKVHHDRRIRSSPSRHHVELQFAIESRLHRKI